MCTSRRPRATCEGGSTQFTSSHLRENFLPFSPSMNGHVRLLDSRMDHFHMSTKLTQQRILFPTCFRGGSECGQNTNWRTPLLHSQ